MSFIILGGASISKQLDAILSAVQILTKQGQTIMNDLSTLKADVANETSVMQSAETLIAGLAEQITAAGTDPVALKALTDTMETNSAALAAAVHANQTPAPPPPPGPDPTV